MPKPLFAHRPPSTGTHLLNDPLPDWIARDFPSRPETESASSPRRPRAAKGKKSNS